MLAFHVREVQKSIKNTNSQKFREGRGPPANPLIYALPMFGQTKAVEIFVPAMSFMPEKGRDRPTVNM